MYKVLFLIILSLFLVMCSVNRNASQISINYIIVDNETSLSFKDVIVPKLISVRFNDFFLKNEELCKKDLSVDIELSDKGVINEIMLDCKNKLQEQTKQSIINNIKEWDFEPAKTINGDKLASSININWSVIFSDWQTLFSNPDIPDKWKLEPLYISENMEKPIKMVPPKYPKSALKNNITGDVFLAVRILEDGSVGHILITKSLFESLDESSVNAVKQWIFHPMIDEQGNHIIYWIEFPVSFQMDRY